MKFGSQLSADLRGKHGKRSVRPRVGYSVKIVRGAFNGIVRTITKVDSFTGTVNVEGVTHEKLKGGNAPVPIRSSNVVITALVLEDKQRKLKLEVSA